MISRFIFRLLLLGLLGVAVWLVGFIWFFIQIPASEVTTFSNIPKADAIIVLTGGRGRLEYGLKLMEKGRADWIFVSGVNKRVTKDQIFDFALAKHSVHYEKKKHQIILGYEATSTLTNAKESKVWMRDQKFDSLLLVTSDYHMFRALLEFDRQLPAGINIIPVPAPSKIVTSSAALQSLHTWRILMQEYNKYVVSYASPYLVPIIALWKEYR